MSLYDELGTVKRGRAKVLMLNDMADFYRLGALLEKMTHPEEVIPYLRLEIQTKNRSSTVSRLYGRYRKLLPVRDLAQLQVWREHYGSEGSCSGETPGKNGKEVRRDNS